MRRKIIIFFDIRQRFVSDSTFPLTFNTLLFRSPTPYVLLLDFMFYMVTTIKSDGTSLNWNRRWFATKVAGEIVGVGNSVACEVNHLSLETIEAKLLERVKCLPLHSIALSKRRAVSTTPLIALPAATTTRTYVHGKQKFLIDFFLDVLDFALRWK